MSEVTTPSGSGRQAEAARNDGRILDAARVVFLADPSAPISAVATRAGVGISALYRRYPSKQKMLHDLTRDGLQRFLADLEAALADPGDPWSVYTACLQQILAGQSQALAQRLAGSFTPTTELVDLATRAGDRYTALHRRAQRAGVLRKDVTSADVIMVLEAVSLIDLPGPAEDPGRGAERVAQLRRRYLALFLQSLCTPAAPDRLPGPAATEPELSARWSPRAG